MNKNILSLYFYIVNLEFVDIKKPFISVIKPLFYRKKTFISVIKPLFQKPKPFKKTFIFENQSWQPEYVHFVYKKNPKNCKHREKIVNTGNFTCWVWPPCDVHIQSFITKTLPTFPNPPTTYCMFATPV